MKPNIPQKKFDEDAFIARMRRQHGDDWSTSVEANMEDAKESAQNRNDRAKKYQKRGEIYHHIIIPSCKYEGPQGYGDNNGVYSFRTKPIMGGSTKPPRTSTPNLPPALTAPPELTADVLGTGQPPTPAAPKPKRKSAARSGQPMKQNVTLVETWTQGEDSFGGAETKTGKTHKNLTQAQALKRIKDNPHKNYDIYVGGERVMLWSGAGRPFRVEYSPERKSKQTQAPKHKPAPARKPKKTRSEIQKELHTSSKIPISTILQEIRELKPMGRRSEMGTIMGVMPTKGVPVATPIGEFVFAKHRQPTREQLKKWERLQKESEKMTRKVTWLSFGSVLEGGTIGNKLAQQHGEELLKAGMLTSEEATQIQKTRKFWKEHPHADTGIVKGGEILELSDATGEIVPKKTVTQKATPPQTISPAKEEYLRKRDRIDKEQFEKWGIGAPPTPRLPPLTPPAAARKPAPAPNLPPILTAPPELTADVFGTGPMGLTPTPATPKARKPKTKVAAAPKAKPKATKPKAKKTAAAQKLTAAQREHLAIQGFVMVRRGGKYVKITG